MTAEEMAASLSALLDPLCPGLDLTRPDAGFMLGIAVIGNKAAYRELARLRAPSRGRGRERVRSYTDYIVASKYRDFAESRKTPPKSRSSVMGEFKEAYPEFEKTADDVLLHTISRGFKMIDVIHAGLALLRQYHANAWIDWAADNLRDPESMFIKSKRN